MTTRGQKFDRKLFLIVGIALLAVMTFAAYRTLRRGVSLIFGDFFYPYLAVGKAGSDYVSDRTLLLYSRMELVAKLEELQKVNRHLAMRAQIAGELLGQNEELRRLLSLKAPDSWRYIGAEIILRDPLHWQEQFVVNQGAAAGIRENSAVMTVAADGRPIFIGVVASVGKRSSRVITVFHPALRMSLRFGSGEIGVLNAGNRSPGPGEVPVGFLPADGAYVLQKAVLSTGFERGVPGGLKIGELCALGEKPSVFSDSLHIDGAIKAAAQMDSIRFVLIADRETSSNGEVSL